MRTLIAMLMLLPLVAGAGEWQIHLVSEHAGHKSHLNEENYGLGYVGDGDVLREMIPACEWLRCRGTVGYYTNSWFRDSLYAGVNFPLGGGWSVSGVLVSGYRGVNDQSDRYLIGGELLPLPLIHLDLAPSRDVSPVLSLAPTRDGGVVLLSIRVER